MKVLYLTYTGLTEPLGRSQILPYLTGLTRRGVVFEAISFEPSTNRHTVEQHTLSTNNPAIRTFMLTRPSASSKARKAAGVLAGMKRAYDYAMGCKFDVIHCRNAFAAELAIRISRRTGAPYLFDMRGFWGDARAENGTWSQHTAAGRIIYKGWKRRERAYIRTSRITNVLTQKAKSWITSEGLKDERDVIVTPCCVDFASAATAMAADLPYIRNALGVTPGELLCVYTGSAGGVYDDGRLLRSFAVIRSRQRAKLLILGSRTVAEWLAVAAIEGVALDSSELICKSLPHQSVLEHLACSDLGFSFLKPSFSSRGVSSTKVGEYASVGLPFIANAGIGDMPEIAQHVGDSLVLPDDPGGDEEHISSFLASLGRTSRADVAARARELFDIDRAIDNYFNAYSRMLETSHDH